MLKLSLKILFLISLTLHEGFSRRFTEIELAKELYNQGMKLEDINDWVCLVMGESSGDTSAMNHHNTDGSKDWGLFQINDHWWCGGHYKGRNGCNVRCEELATSDITTAAKCAKIIKSQQGFKAWVAWVNKCQGRRLTDYTQYICGRHT